MAATVTPLPRSAPTGAPEYLDEETREVWDRLASEIALTPRDLDTFEVLCTVIIHHRRASALVTRSGVLLVKDGVPVPNPAMAVAQTLATQILQLSQRFGLTPGDRAAPTAGTLRPRPGA